MKELSMRIIILLLLFSVANSAYAIKKCKDADGKWFYGDIAVEECENSKVTTLNDRGFITEEKAAPKTEEEIKAEEEEVASQEASEEKAIADELEKLRILSIYETEADIDRQRDNQLYSVQSNMAVHKAYLKGMDSRIARFEEKLAETKSKRAKESYTKKIKDAKVRVENSKNELIALEAQKGDINKKFAKEKEVYLALKYSDEEIEH